MNASLASGSHFSHHSGAKNKGVGYPVLPTDKTKKVSVTTTDEMRFYFSPEVEIQEGEIISFKVTNKGKVPHEFSIGNQAEQVAHQKMMRKMPNMVHNDGNTITIEPGQTKTITWKFIGNETVVFSCNIPGHYEAGMYKKVKIK
jgi:uncharacterized cupredoxin-like copper-binding protein